MRVSWLSVVAVIVFGGVGAPPVSAQSGNVMPVRTGTGLGLIEEGRQQLFNLRLDAAHATFRELAREEGGAAPAAYHRSVAFLLQSLITDDEDDFAAFFEHADRFEDAVDEMQDTVWRDYFDGELNLHRAMANVKTEHYVQAALSARSAYKAFDRVVDRDPDFYEAYKGRGIVHLAIGATPGGYRRILHFLGYEGEIEQGLDELEKAAAHSRYGREEAQLIRALIAVTMSRDPEGGLSIMRDMRADYPDSPLVGYFYGFVLLSNRQAEEAERVLQETHDEISRPGTLYVDYVDFYLGEAHFVQNEFADAEGAYRRYLLHHDGPALRAMAMLRTGLSIEMQDRRDEAITYYRRVEGDRDYDSDRWARQEARLRLEQPLSGTERAMLKARNAFDAGWYERAEPALLALFEEEHTLPVRAEAAYRLGRLYHVQERYGEAMSYYRWAIDHPLDDDSKWAPWGQFYMGIVHLENDRLDQADAALRSALDYGGDFDFKYGLEQRAKAALERVRSRRG